MNNVDTIAGIATAVTNSGVAIIRISGSNALNIADYVFRNKKGGRSLISYCANTINHGYIYDEDDLIDEVLVSVFHKPFSYTGEDIVEINTHGGVYITNRVLELLIKAGARIADPGEFTKRAYMNGKIDLARAEAVMDIINAQNDYALKTSMNQLSGKLSTIINTIRDCLVDEVSYIEASLDDPEHYDIDEYAHKLLDIVQGCLNSLNNLSKTAKDGIILKEGIDTVILGRPNVGKSSILNMLLGRDRAIVTDVAGTTRDALEEYITLDGIGLRIIDTAGVHSTNDIVERLGVSITIDKVKDSDLVIYVVDASVPIDSSEIEVVRLLKDKRAIILLNKIDLGVLVDIEELRVFVTSVLGNKEDICIIPISAKLGEGTKLLTDSIKEMYSSGIIDYNSEVILTAARHKECIDSAISSLNLVYDAIIGGASEDLIVIDMVNAISSLGSILGVNPLDSIQEEIINNIFSKFCTGK